MVYDNRQRRGGTISGAIEMFTQNPVPYRIILILTGILLLFVTQWRLSWINAAVQTSLRRKLISAILFKAIPILIMLFLHWTWSSDTVRKSNRKAKSSSDEGNSPWIVLGLIFVLLLMAHYSPAIRNRLHF
ncbi:hypothetical protein ACFE04_006631 [Oxalis oulophora]